MMFTSWQYFNIFYVKKIRSPSYRSAIIQLTLSEFKLYSPSPRGTFWTSSLLKLIKKKLIVIKETKSCWALRYLLIFHFRYWYWIPKYPGTYYSHIPKRMVSMFSGNAKKVRFPRTNFVFFVCFSRKTRTKLDTRMRAC